MKHVVVQIELLRLDGFPSDADARAGQPSRRPKNHHAVYGIIFRRSFASRSMAPRRTREARASAGCDDPSRPPVRPKPTPTRGASARTSRFPLDWRSGRAGRVRARYRVFVDESARRFRPSSRRPVRCGRCLLSSLDGFAHRSVSSLVVVYVHHPKRRSFRRRRARFRLAGQARLGEKRRNRRRRRTTSYENTRPRFKYLIPTRARATTARGRSASVAGIELGTVSRLASLTFSAASARRRP